MMKKLIFPLLTVLFLTACGAELETAIPETNEEHTETPVFEHTLGQSCETNEDCVTPMEYMIQSNCPFGSACIDNQCVVVCPLMTECQTDSDCDCSTRSNKTLDCICIENTCLSVEAQDEIYLD
jgi:hypothetical protein